MRLTILNFLVFLRKFIISKEKCLSRNIHWIVPQDAQAGFVRCAAPAFFHAAVREVRRAAPVRWCRMTLMRMLFTIWIGLDYPLSVMRHRELNCRNSLDLRAAENSQVPVRYGAPRRHLVRSTQSLCSRFSCHIRIKVENSVPRLYPDFHMLCNKQYYLHNSQCYYIPPLYVLLCPQIKVDYYQTGAILLHHFGCINLW